MDKRFIYIYIYIRSIFFEHTPSFSTGGAYSVQRPEYMYGWTLEISNFLGPKWHLPIGSMPFHRPKNSRLPGPNPSRLPKYWMLPALKALHQRCINSYCSSHSPSFIIVDLLQMYMYGVRYIQLFLRDRVSEIFYFRFFS